MIEIQTVGLNSVETEFSQMPDLLCAMVLSFCTYWSFPFGDSAISP